MLKDNGKCIRLRVLTVTRRKINLNRNNDYYCNRNTRTRIRGTKYTSSFGDYPGRLETSTLRKVVSFEFGSEVFYLEFVATQFPVRRKFDKHLVMIG